MEPPPSRALLGAERVTNRRTAFIQHYRAERSTRRGEVRFPTIAALQDAIGHLLATM